MVLDLDNTLIHSILTKPLQGDPQSFEIKNIDDTIIYVYKRPYLDNFLRNLQLFSDVHLFTASNREYANQIIAIIDPNASIF